MTGDERSAGRRASPRLRSAWATYRWPLIAAAAVVAFALGYVGYASYYETQQTQPGPVSLTYLVIQLIWFNSYVGPDGIPWTLQIARFLVPFVALSAAISSVAGLFYGQWESVRARRLRGHVIVCGLGTVGTYVTRRLCERGEAVVVVDPDRSHPDVSTVRGAGALLVCGDAALPRTLRRVNVGRARRLIACAGDDAMNASIALAARETATSDGGALACHVLVGDAQLFEALTEQHFRASDAQRYWLEFFNVDDAAARAVVTDHIRHDVQVEADSNPVDVAVYGRPGLASCVVTQLARLRAREVTKERLLRVLWAGPEAEALAERLQRRWPQIGERLDLITAASIDEWRYRRVPDGGHAEHTPVSCIIACDAGWAEGLRLEQESRTDGTHVVLMVADPGGLGGLLGASSAPDQGLTVVSTLEAACEPDILLGGVGDELARAIHDTYRRQWSPGPGQAAPAERRAFAPWQDLDEDLKDQNRAQAADILGKLRDIGCDLAPSHVVSDTGFEFTDEEVELLAEREHERWMATKQAQGWSHAPVRDDAAKRHPDMKPWAELDEPTRQKDRDAVLLIPSLVLMAGYGVTRRRQAQDQ